VLLWKDFEKLREVGVNVLRLGIIWAGWEPTRGAYNISYIQVLRDIVLEASQYGIYTVLDMHQDLFSDSFCGEGMPSWAVAPSQSWMKFPQPARPWPMSGKDFDNKTGLPTRQACSALGPADGLGFAELYFAEPTQHAFQALYDDVNSLRVAWADAWAEALKHFEGVNALLGVELINEPFAGNTLANPTLLNPGVADQTNLLPAYDYLAKRIHSIAPNILVFFAGVTWGRWGTGFPHAPNKEPTLSVLAFHYYKPLDNVWLPGAEEQFRQNAEDEASLQVGGMVTEMFSPTCDASYSQTLDLAEQYSQSYILWQYKAFCEESEKTLHSKSQDGSFGSCKTGGGCGFFEQNGQPIAASFQETARTYATAVAGRYPQGKFDNSTGIFMLCFTVDEAISSKTNTTEIFLSAEHFYSKGFIVEILPSGAARWQAGNSSIQVQAHVESGTNITVIVKPTIDS